MTVVDGIGYVAWPDQGCYVEVGKTPEDVGALYAPMLADGGMDTENVGEIEVPYADA